MHRTRDKLAQYAAFALIIVVAATAVLLALWL